jgi:hypothetical protein
MKDALLNILEIPGSDAGGWLRSKLGKKMGVF